MRQTAGGLPGEMCLMRISSWRQDQGTGTQSQSQSQCQIEEPSTVVNHAAISPAPHADRDRQNNYEEQQKESASARERGRGRGRRRESAHKCQNLWRCLLLDKSGIENRFLVLFFFFFLLLLLLFLISCFWPKRTALARHGMGNWPAVNCRPLMTSSLCV